MRTAEPEREGDRVLVLRLRDTLGLALRQDMERVLADCDRLLLVEALAERVAVVDSDAEEESEPVREREALDVVVSDALHDGEELRVPDRVKVGMAVTV